MKTYKVLNAGLQEDGLTIIRSCHREDPHVHIISVRKNRKKWTKVCVLPCRTYDELKSDIMMSLIEEGFSVKTEVSFDEDYLEGLAPNVIAMADGVVPECDGFYIPRRSGSSAPVWDLFLYNLS